MTKSILLFCAKSVAFTIIFWVLWTAVLNPIFMWKERNSTAVQSTQTEAQVSAYEKQVARVNRQLDVVAAQQERMEKNLTAQEENTKRFAALLSVWEGQGIPKK